MDARSEPWPAVALAREVDGRRGVRALRLDVPRGRRRPDPRRAARAQGRVASPHGPGGAGLLAWRAAYPFNQGAGLDPAKPPYAIVASRTGSTTSSGATRCCARRSSGTSGGRWSSARRRRHAGCPGRSFSPSSRHAGARSRGARHGGRHPTVPPQPPSRARRGAVGGAGLGGRDGSRSRAGSGRARRPVRALRDPDARPGDAREMARAATAPRRGPRPGLRPLARVATPGGSPRANKCAS